MKRFFVFIAFAGLSAACAQGPQQSANSNNSAANAPLRAEKLQTTTAHTSENQPPPAESLSAKPAGPQSGKWSQGGDPIDTSSFDAKIKSAEEAVKAGKASKEDLAQAYFERGFALTEARQYASALGDYRRALKNDPNHEESKKWVDQIIGIYSMMKKEYPKEGEEPEPLPWKG